MDYKNMYIIAGCNGAGKTTAFRKTLSARLGNPEFVNPDIIAKSINREHQWEVRISAGREAIRQIDEKMEQGVSFCVETTLTARSYAQTIKKAQDKGYKVDLYYYWLESAEASLRRVEQRAKEGANEMDVDNHTIPEDIIRRRYPKSINNLFEFIPKVDSWHVYDNNLGLALPIAEDGKVYDSNVWNAIKLNDPKKSIVAMDIVKLVETIGIRQFSETVLLEKLKRNESVVYSINGRVEIFSPNDILWIYANSQRDLEDWEITHLKSLAKEGKDQYYTNGKHFPASMILKLYGIEDYN